MLDRAAIALLRPALEQGGRLLHRLGVTANTVTLVGFAIGIGAAVAITQRAYALGLVLLLASRLCDGLDGALARLTRPTDRGAYLDIVLDFLFYAGMAFAYFVVFPIMFGFFASVTPQGVAMMTDIGQYLDFVLTLFFAFGVAFEIPIATFLVIWVGLIDVATLRKSRPYVIVGCFVVGMVLTPPDVFSQTLLAVPMWLLFESGLLAGALVKRKRDEEQAEEDAKPEDQPPAPLS